MIKHWQSTFLLFMVFKTVLLMSNMKGVSNIFCFDFRVSNYLRKMKKCIPRNFNCDHCLWQDVNLFHHFYFREYAPIFTIQYHGKQWSCHRAVLWFSTCKFRGFSDFCHVKNLFPPPPTHCWTTINPLTRLGIPWPSQESCEKCVAKWWLDVLSNLTKNKQSKNLSAIKHIYKVMFVYAYIQV